jgi:hypothetical protein
MTGKVIGIFWHEDCIVSGVMWACRFSNAGHSLRLLNEGEPWHECDVIFFVDQYLPLDKRAKNAGNVKFTSRRMETLIADLEAVGFDKPRKEGAQRGVYYASDACAIEGCASPFHMVNCYKCNGRIDNARNSDAANSAATIHAAAQAAY